MKKHWLLVAIAMAVPAAISFAQQTGLGGVPGAGAAAGSGTVTSFSFPTTLGGLFACSVTNATSTPAVNCTVTNAAANSVYGNFSGSAGAPGFSNAPVFSAAGLTNFPTLNQSTTGTAAGLSGPSALPSGTTASTQSSGDNSNKVATDAFVLANSVGSGTVSSGPQYAIPGYTANGTGTAVGPSNITVDSTGNNLTVPGGIVAGSPTGGNEGTGTINVTTGYEINGISIANCLGGTAKVIQGVSYTHCYPQSHFDQRVNAANADAVNLANGNTTGIIDSTYEAQDQSQTTQITIGGVNSGNGNPLPVLWKVGTGLYDLAQLTSNTSYAVEQLNKSAIECEGSVQEGGCQIINDSAAGNIYALYGVPNAGYYTMNGMYFRNYHGSTFASGHMAIINGGYDGSLWSNNQFDDDAQANPSNGATVLINWGCCHANFLNNFFGSEWGATAVDIEPGNGQANAINFQDSTFNSHGPTATGNPMILCHDSGPGLRTAISFSGVTYMEGENAAMSAPFIQDNGCRALEFSGILEAYPLGGAGTTSPIIAVSSAFDTTLNVGATVAYGSNSSTWNYPATVVEQYNTTADCASPPCAVAVTDSAGNSPGYHSRTSQFNNSAVGGNLTVGGSATLGSPAGGTMGAGTLNATGLYVNGTPVVTGTGTVTGVTATAPIASSGGNAPVISCPTCATAGANSNISSLSGLSTPLTTAEGGTGEATLTGIRQANGASADSTATSSQIQSAIGNGVYVPAGSYYGGTATGAVNVPAITLPAGLGSPTLSQLTGVPISFIPNLANTSTTPTLNVNSLGAVTIVKGTSTALVSGDLATSTPAFVVYNGANFLLQNPQVGLSQSLSYTNFNVTSITASNGSFKAGSTGQASTFQGGSDGASSGAGGSGTLRGDNNSGTGAAGNAYLQAGANTSTGQQGFASVAQSFTIAAATTVGYVMAMAATSDKVQAAGLGATNIVGVATSAGGTNAQLYVASNGKILAAFDGTPVVGDFACAPPASTGTAGLAHDNGATACPAGQKLGVVTGQVSGSGSGATATVLLQIGS